MPTKYLNLTKLLVISFFCFFQSSFNSHKFYVSVTDVEYSSEKQSLQIISRVFADDFENVLKKRYKTSVVLLPDEETNDADKWISRYINQKLNISIKGVTLQLNYIGKRYEEDRVYLYVEVENVSKFNSIAIENLILTDLFEEQKNLVHVKVKNQTKSKVLTKAQPSHTFSY